MAPDGPQRHPDASHVTAVLGTKSEAWHCSSASSDTPLVVGRRRVGVKTLHPRGQKAAGCRHGEAKGSLTSSPPGLRLQRRAREASTWYVPGTAKPLAGHPLVSQLPGG